MIIILTNISGEGSSILFTDLKVYSYLWTSTDWGQVGQNRISQHYLSCKVRREKEGKRVL